MVSHAVLAIGKGKCIDMGKGVDKEKRSAAPASDTGWGYVVGRGGEDRGAIEGGKPEKASPSSQEVFGADHTSLVKHSAVRVTCNELTEGGDYEDGKQLSIGALVAHWDDARRAQLASRLEANGL